MDDIDAIRFQLTLLAEYETVNIFVRNFYELILDELAAASERSPELCALFSELLDWEIEHHYEIERSGHEGPAHGEDLLQLSDTLRRRLEDFARRASDKRLVPTTARALIAAECAYYLRSTAEVIRHIETAIHAGCSHPLTYFSLGYNYFDLALQRLRGKSDVEHLDAQERADVLYDCIDAVRAFARGRTGSEFDAQIYYWIGAICEFVGANEEAAQAYARATEIDIDFAELLEDKLDRLLAFDDDVRSESDPLTVFRRNVAEILSS